VIYSRYQDRADPAFWLKLCEIKSKRHHADPGIYYSIEHLTGWTGKLFASEQDPDNVEKVKLQNLHVLVRLVNELKGTLKECFLVDGFRDMHLNSVH